MDFKSIIKEQREELEKIEKEEKIIERTGLNKSKESLKYPNILAILGIRRTKKIILTGSNSKLLSGELSTHLTGRYLDIILFPFSFKEFLKLKEVKENKVYTTQEKAGIMKTLQEYLEIGGFPEAYKFGKGMISKIYEDILTKDILLRYNIS